MIKMIKYMFLFYPVLDSCIVLDFQGLRKDHTLYSNY